MRKELLFAVGIVAIALLSRFIPHPPNFTPILAIALFGGAIFKNKAIAYSVTLGSMFIADLFLGLHESLWAVYLCLALFVFIGTNVKRKNSKSITLSAISSSIIFFLLTNFSVWAFTTLYSSNLAGLMSSYTMALPFFKWNLLSTLLCSGAMFGIYNLLEKYNFGFTQLAEENKK
jgi:hypothetical protein